MISFRCASIYVIARSDERDGRRVGWRKLLSSWNNQAVRVTASAGTTPVVGSRWAGEHVRVGAREREREWEQGLRGWVETGRQAGRLAGRKELRLRAETAGLDARAATPERVAVYRGCWPSVPAREKSEREVRRREKERGWAEKSDGRSKRKKCPSREEESWSGSGARGRTSPAIRRLRRCRTLQDEGGGQPPGEEPSSLYLPSPPTPRYPPPECYPPGISFAPKTQRESRTKLDAEREETGTRERQE